MTVKEFSENELLFNKLYEKTKDCGRTQFVNLLMQAERENQELKQQLEKKYEKVGTLTGELLYEENTKLINQQKEFIEWLENSIKNLETEQARRFNHTYQYKIDVFKDCLFKYKEIVGDDND